MTADSIVDGRIVDALRAWWPGADFVVGVTCDGGVVVHLPFRPGDVCGEAARVVSGVLGRPLLVRGFVVTGGRMRLVLAPVSPA